MADINKIKLPGNNNPFDIKDLISHIELTWSEYQQLPSTKNSNNVNYYITDKNVIYRNGIEYGGSSAGGGSGIYITSSVTALSGATSVTIQDSHIHTTSFVLPYANDGTVNTPSAPTTITKTEGQAVLTFNALSADTDFYLLIFMQSGSGVEIDDTTPASNKVYSSQKIENTFAKKADMPILTSAVSALTGATSCTITNANIHTSSLIEPMASVQGMGQPTMTVTEGECLLEFPALAQDTSFRLRITN